MMRYMRTRLASGYGKRRYRRTRRSAAPSLMQALKKVLSAAARGGVGPYSKYERHAGRYAKRGYRYAKRAYSRGRRERARTPWYEKVQ